VSALSACPQCKSGFTYEDAQMYVCSECGHEWTKDTLAESAEPEVVVRDGDHNIGCKIEGFGSMKLKSEFVKKA
jgi:protein PhnA